MVPAFQKQRPIYLGGNDPLLTGKVHKRPKATCTFKKFFAVFFISSSDFILSLSLSVSLYILPSFLPPSLLPSHPLYLPVITLELGKDRLVQMLCFSTSCFMIFSFKITDRQQKNCQSGLSAGRVALTGARLPPCPLQREPRDSKLEENGFLP